MALRYRVWTDDEVAKLSSMIERGVSAQRAAVSLKRPLDSIKKRAKDLGKPFEKEAHRKKRLKQILGTPR
jgi:hypothetical protein